MAPLRANKRVNDGVALELAWVERVKDRRHMLLAPLDRHSAASVDQHQHRPRVGGDNRLQQLLLRPREPESRAVVTLVLDARGAVVGAEPEEEHGHVRRLGRGHRAGDEGGVRARRIQ